MPLLAAHVVHLSAQPEPEVVEFPREQTLAACLTSADASLTVGADCDPDLLFVGYHLIPI